MLENEQQLDLMPINNVQSKRFNLWHLHFLPYGLAVMGRSPFFMQSVHMGKTVLNFSFKALFWVAPVPPQWQQISALPSLEL
jgi:hypothetical protein